MPVLLFSQETEVDIEELRQRITGEAPAEIMALDLGDSEVSIFITGSWMGNLQANFGYSFSPIGTAFNSPETPLLFTQETDITLSLWINKRWFVEASFLDDYERNTYRAGYQGQQGEFVQYAGIGNTGLDFPSFPYLDLGGDSPTSFGFYGRMGSDALKIHTLVRYDAASRDEKVFSGGRERTFTYVEPDNAIRGVSFVLPDENIQSDIIVYIEDEKGSLRDLQGRRFRLALQSEYAAGKTSGLLDLSIRPQGIVAVSYSGIGANLGSYGTSGFLAEVQSWFSGIDLSNYPQCGDLKEITINGNNALVIYERGTFSPFERLNRYDAPSSTSEKAELVRLSSGSIVSAYNLVQLDINAASADLPLYIAAVSQRNVYELLPVVSGFSQRHPYSRWPLAQYPEYYLPGAAGGSQDLSLRFTNYGTVGAYFIGTDVVPGSIQVWRSGIQDTNFSFNAASGEVSLFGPVGANELIRVTYLKQSDQTQVGSVAAGVGVEYKNANTPFSVQAALGARWNVSEEGSYTEEGLSSPGTVGISAKTAWDYDYLKAHLAAGFSLVNNDTTDLYRAAGMEGNERVLSLPYETSFLSHPPASSLISGLDTVNRAGLTYRNYFDNNILGSTLMPVNWNGAVVVTGLNRPYPVKDPQIDDAQSLAMEFTLGGNEWTGFQVPMNFDSGVLARAREIEIPYRFYDFSGDTSDFKLIIQIGALSGKDFAFTENLELIWEQELFSGGMTDINGGLKIKRFVLSETDRLRLGDAKYLRLIAVNSGAGEEAQGRVLLSPPIVRGASFRGITYDSITGTISAANDFSGENIVSVTETIDGTLRTAYKDTIDRLHPADGTQRVLKVEWEEMGDGISAGIDGRIGELPLSDYRALSFFVKGADVTGGTLRFIAASGPNSLNDPYLEANIPLSAFRAGRWSKVTIKYQGNNTGVIVDGGGAAGSSFKYRRKDNAIDSPEQTSVYIAVLVNPGVGTALDNASLSIDEIALEDASMVYRTNAGTAIEYSRAGQLLSVGKVNVLSDFKISNTAESEFRTEEAEDGAGTEGSVANRTGAEITVLGTKVRGNLLFTAAKESFIWSADHGIAGEWGPLQAGETFYASPYENSARHGFNIGFNSPFYAKFDADANYNFSRLERKWNLGAGYRADKDYIPSIAVGSSAAWAKFGSIEEDEGYGKLWADTWGLMIPDAGAGEESRRTSASITITENTKPVGAVISLNGATYFSGANNLTRLDNSAFLDVPVTLQRARINFRAGRAFTRQLFFAGEDALSDGDKFFESINDSLPLWSVFPGYSLFTEDLGKAMDETIEGSASSELAQYTLFNDHFSARVSLPSFYNLYAFIIPSGASFRLERNMEQKMDIRSDMLNLAAGLSFSAINMFGAMGYKPLFKFYQSDEFSHAIETAFIIPKEEEVSYRIQSAAGASFRGFQGGVFSLVNTLTFRSDDRWLEGAVIDWTFPVNKSLTGVFYNWIASAAARQSSWLTLSTLLNSEYEKLFKESLELSIEKYEEYLNWSLSLGHESIVRILGRLNFSTYVKLRLRENPQSEIFIMDALLGTSLRVSF